CFLDRPVSSDSELRIAVLVNLSEIAVAFFAGACFAFLPAIRGSLVVMCLVDECPGDPDSLIKFSHTLKRQKALYLVLRQAFCLGGIRAFAQSLQVNSYCPVVRRSD